MKPQQFCDDYCTNDIKVECDCCYIRPIMTDMDDEITRLKAENDKLRKAQEWISVEDRLPEFDTDVLAAYFEHHIKEYWVDKRIDFLDDETFELVGSMWTEGEPTHWQPLPAPPEPTDE